MKFEKITPGLVLYDVHRHKMGNTTMSTVGVWPVKIETIDHEKRCAKASWNGNRATLYFARDLERLRTSEPVLVPVGWGHRLQTRDEKAAARAAAATQKEPQP